MLRKPSRLRCFAQSVLKQPMRKTTALAIFLLACFLIRTSRNYESTYAAVGAELAGHPAAAAAAAAPAAAPGPSLRSYLNFSERTALNFMHFHKTGGVSFKAALYSFFSRRRKRDGTPVRFRDACYARNVSAGASELQSWECNWNPVWAQPEAERNRLDVVFGHQYRLHGVDAFLNRRSVRTFTVLRHPLAKKVSFYFHFLVREFNRAESSVTVPELRAFLLYDRNNGSMWQDGGPNYMAGHLLSDGVAGFVGASRHRYFRVAAADADAVAARSIAVLRSYVFVGLQTRPLASMCLLRKTVEHFCDAHGVRLPDPKGIAVHAYGERHNSGSYKLTAEKMWAELSPQDRAIFEKREKVDLAIYEEGVRLFHKQVKMFGCDNIRGQSKRGTM